MERHYKPDLQVQDEKKMRMLREFTRGSVHENGHVTGQDDCSVENKCHVLKSEVKTDQSELNEQAGGFLCSVCGEKFLEDDSFIKHINDHVNSSDKQNRSRCEEFQNDNSMKGSGISNISDDCTISQENPNPQENILASEKVLKFPDCSTSNVSARKTSLQYPLITQTGVKSYTCLYCSYATVRKSHLRVHIMMTHSGEKPFKCSDCSYATVRKSHLRVHMMTHSGEKPFKCSDCPYTAVRKAHLKIHMNIHSGEKPFKCSDRSYATVRKSHLRVHIMMTHSGEKPIKCSDCSYTTVRKSSLRDHLMTHSGEKPFKCSVCSYAAAQKSNLLKHQKIHAREI